jgi:hypothetical protein
MIKQDVNNYRKHSDKNKRIIKKSLDELGAGRSILIDNENSIIAGNGVAEQWGDKPVRIIETDGSELIAIKRTDLQTTDEKRKTLALIDNHASDTSDFDNELINSDFDSDTLNEWEFEAEQSFSDKNQEIDTNFEDTKYTFKLEYSESEYLELKEKIAEVGKTPEAIFYDALISL